jgi:acetyl esterase
MTDLTTMDPQTKAILDMMATQESKPLSETSPAEFREQYRTSSEMMDGTDIEIDSVEDRTIPGPDGEIPVRIYRPVSSGSDSLPILVFYHGGGWVIGDLDTHDAACRHICGDAGIIVMAVDYRLAPENPFPAPIEDAIAAVSWVEENAAEIGADATKIAVGGDSAGGNLAAVVCHHMRDTDGTNIVYQMLWYPGVGQEEGKTSSSMEEFASGFLLQKETMDWFEAHYGGGRDISGEPQYAIIRADNCSNLPPALLLTAGFDPLQDDGQSYGRKMQAAGVAVDFAHFESTIHGFLTMGRAIPVAVEALELSSKKLRDAFS